MPNRLRQSFQFVAVSAALTSATPAFTQSAPVWQSLPSAQRFSEVYPVPALFKGVGGQVVLLCVSHADGSLTGCAIQAERPPGWGFAAAAIRLVPDFKLTAGPSREGQSVSVPISFKPPKAVTAVKP